MKQNPNLNFINEYLKACRKDLNGRTIIKGKKHVPLNQIRRFSVSDRLDPKYVYLCSSTAYQEKTDPCCCYILIGQDDPSFSCSGRIILPEGTDPDEIYEIIQEMFVMVNDWEMSLLCAITEGADINELLRLSSSIFGNNSITVVDPSLLLIGFIKNSDPNDMMEQSEWFQNRRYIRSQDHSPLVMRRPLKQTEPFFSIESVYIPNVKVLRAYAFSPNGYFQATVTVSQHEGILYPYHKDLICFLAQCISSVLTMDAMKLHEASDTGILGDLLSGKIDYEKSSTFHNFLGWNDHAFFRIIIMNPPETEAAHREILQNIKSILNMFLPLSRIVPYSGQIVLILYTEDKQQFSDKLDCTLEQCMQQFNVTGRISNIASGFDHIHMLYIQALYALQTVSEIENKGQKDKFLIPYSHYLLYHMFNIACTQYTHECFIHPYVDTLLQYDKEHNSHLLKSFYYYLFLNRSHSACAEILNIHKSTFRYRLNIINSLIPVNYDDQEECLNLMLSARLCLSSDPKIQI